jgi:hypothetical protein
VAGDLQLSDDDEAPSDGVQATFVASNLAPGDEHVAELGLHRDADTQLPARLDPRVEVRIDTNGSEVLAEHLRVSELAYDGDLSDRTREACGERLTLAELASCTGREEHPLASLPDPTPDGRDLRLGVELVPDAGNRLQDREVGFTVTVELYAEPLASVDESCSDEGQLAPAAAAELGPEPASLLDGRRPIGSGTLAVLLGAQLPAC